MKPIRSLYVLSFRLLGQQDPPAQPSRMTITIRSLIATALLFALGCAKTDWIDRTLVTVDVTGTWAGSMGGTSSVTTEIRLEARQEGSKVTGYFRPMLSSYPSWTGKAGPIDGNVAGDKFYFKTTDGVITGELTVSGDDMTGYVSTSRTMPISMRRTSSSPPPSPQ